MRSARVQELAGQRLPEEYIETNTPDPALMEPDEFGFADIFIDNGDASAGRAVTCNGVNCYTVIGSVNRGLNDNSSLYAKHLV